MHLRESPTCGSSAAVAGYDLSFVRSRKMARQYASFDVVEMLGDTRSQTSRGKSSLVYVPSFADRFQIVGVVCGAGRATRGV